MNALPAPLDIRSWLELATKGLPAEARERICEEIEDHYWSSASHYQEQGKSPAEARQRAIAELGDVREAHGAFHDAHASKGRYLLAGILSMTMPLLFAVIFLKEPEYLVSGGPFREALIGFAYLLQPLLLALPMLAIIRAGSSLLGYRFHFSIGKWRVGLLIVGFLLAFLPSVLNGVSLMATGQAFFLEPGPGEFVTVHGIIGDSGILLLSFGLVTIGYHISRLKHSLYGMRSMLMISAWAWGLIQAGLVFLETGNTITLLVFTLMFTATAFCILLGWMFIKAALMGKPLLPIPTMGRTNSAA